MNLIKTSLYSLIIGILAISLGFSKGPWILDAILVFGLLGSFIALMYVKDSDKD